ncbi:helix-turn-helix domain-containing protein [Rhodovarius crocodyli]
MSAGGAPSAIDRPTTRTYPTDEADTRRLDKLSGSARLQLRDVAALLGCTPRMALKLVGAGELPASRVGRIWTARKADIDAYLARTANSAPPRSRDVIWRSPQLAGRHRRERVISEEEYERMIGLRPAISPLAPQKAKRGKIS